MIHLRSLGQCEIDVGDTRLMPTAQTLFATALYLAVEGTRPIPRDHLLELLWPDAEEEKATHSLRQVFYRLRTHGVPLDGDAARVFLPAGSVTTDYDALLALNGSCPVEGLLERIPGGFLPGYMPRASRPFAEWVETQRARVNSVLRRQLVTGISALRGAGDWPATQALAQRCLELDPLNEEATLAFAEAMAMDGSKARAIMIIDRYMNEIGPRAKELHLPATMLKKRITELYPLPPVIERDPPQIGREVEMEKLDAALKDARQAQGGAFLISGPPGIGKTRLVTEFTRAAQLQGFRIARSQMGRHDDHRPLGAWSDLVPIMQRMPGALGCDPESLPFLKRLTSYDSTSTTPSPESQDAEYLFARIRMAILDLVSAVSSESCIIVVIEDVHWMDEWSWDVMSALTKKLEKTGVLILMTRRDGEDAMTPVPKDAVLRGMPLAPLDEARCRKLLGVVGATPRVMEEEFAEWCVKTCAGNPYFLIELGRRASKTDGKFQAPPSLTKLISQRFLDVAPLSRRVLQAAAVLGKNSTLPRIEEVLAEPRVSLLDSLDELAQNSLILTDAERVVCRHDLLGISALSEISALSLRLLHRHAAKVLESEIDENSMPSHLWDAAKHWESAGEFERALYMMDRCASLAIEVGAIGEAIAVLSHIAELLPQDQADRRAVQRRLIRALYLSREYLRLLDVAADIRLTLGADEHLAQLHSPEELYELDARQFATGPTSEALEHALACVNDERAEADHRVSAATIACKLASSLFDPIAGGKSKESVLPLLSQVAVEDALEFQMVFEGSFGSPEKSAAAARLLSSAKGPAQFRARWNKRANNCAYALYLNGESERAIVLLREAIESSDAVGMHAEAVNARGSIVSIQLALGEAEAAGDVIFELEQLQPAEESLGHHTTQEQRIRIALLQGQYGVAKALGAKLYESWQPDFPRGMTHNTAVRHLIRIGADGWCPSDSDMVELRALHHRARTQGLHDFFVYMLTYAFELRGEWDECEALYSAYFTSYRRERGPVLRQLQHRMRRTK